MQSKTMTKGSPWKHILLFSLPVLADSLLQQLYNTVDVIIVGKYLGEVLGAGKTRAAFNLGASIK